MMKFKYKIETKESIVSETVEQDYTSSTGAFPALNSQSHWPCNDLSSKLRKSQDNLYGRRELAKKHRQMKAEGSSRYLSVGYK